MSLENDLLGASKLVLSDDAMALIRETFLDCFSTRFRKPGTKYENVEFTWMVRYAGMGRLIIRDDQDMKGLSIYEFGSCDKLEWDDPNGKYGLLQVQPPKGFHHMRCHEHHCIYDPKRPLRAKDLERAEVLIRLLPQQKADWWAAWGVPEKLDERLPVTNRLALEIYRAKKPEQIRTLEERKQHGRLLALAQIMGLR